MVRADEAEEGAEVTVRAAKRNGRAKAEPETVRVAALLLADDVQQTCVQKERENN